MIKRERTHAIHKHAIHNIISAGRRFLSKAGKNTVHFIVVQDRITLRKIEGINELRSSKAEKVILAILILGDYSDNEHWIEDASAASAGMRIAAQDFGLPHYCTYLRDRTDANGNDMESLLQHLLLFPLHMKPVALMALTEPTGHSTVLDKLKKIHYGRW